MNKVLSIIDTVIKYILVIIVAVLSALGFYQVITRYLFNNASTWSEEAIRFLFIWATCLGGAIGIKEKIHIGIDAIVNLFPKAVKTVAADFVLLLIFAFGVFLTKYGWQLTLKTAVQFSPALQLPMCYVYAAIPTFGVLACYYSVIEIVKSFNTRKEG